MERNGGAGGPAGLPVVVIGAGPVGLVAASHLVARGETPLVLEAGSAVGASIRDWSHVRLFSPWKYLTDPVTRGMLEPTGWELPPADDLPTGGELVAGYLEPLASLPSLAPRILTGRRVVAVTRAGYDKVKTRGRESAPFEVHVRTAGGRKEIHRARAVIDASGTYGTPNPIGASGVPAEGEAELGDRIRYGIPDVLSSERGRYAGRRTLVVGSGHSAFNAVLDLAELARSEPGTEVVWAVRRADEGQMFGGGANDALPARGSLGERLKRLVDAGEVRLVKGFRVERLAALDGRVVVVGDDDRAIGPVDEVVATTGFRPDLAMLRELRLRLDPWLEAPEALAPLIDPNQHSCGTVYPHGYEELKHPEPGFHVVGMKSYGRAPTFLLLTGYEQVRSVVAALTGDMDAARAVELVLPETGVCSTDAGPAASCCGSGDAATAIAPAVAVAAPAVAVSTVAVAAPVAAGSCCA
jgi:thioredoxin reductase